MRRDVDKGSASVSIQRMLHTVHITNLALLERAEIRLADGLTVISGETGGGKSLLITALKLLRGEKVSGSLVRHGAEELQVDGEFRLGRGERCDAVSALVRELCGGALEDDLLLVTRIVDRHGRTRVRIGGRPATLAALRELGAHLLEIHGQGDSRALMRAETQCETLDAFAGTSALRADFAAALATARSLRDRLDALRDGERERRQRLEFLRFQHQAMVDLRLQDGEAHALEQEHQVLSNLDAMRQRLDEALGVLQDGEDNVGDQLARAARAIGEAAAIDVRLQDAAEQMAQIDELVADVCRKLQSGQARLDLDPSRLQEVQERLDEVHGALKRFGPTEADFRQNLARTTAELAQEEAGSDTEALQAQLRAATEAAAAHGRKLLRARHKAAGSFAKAIVGELKDLGMAHTEVRVDMADDFATDALLATATAHGPVPVDLAVRINPGEPFHSMRDTASGGELARIVLAVKKTLADQDRVPLLVFDEIDAEIGGRLGLQVGQKLHEVARHHQVVIVTHLAPVAAFAQHHFLVNKQVAGRAADGGANGKSADAPTGKKKAATHVAEGGAEAAAASAGDERTRSTVRLLAADEVEQELAAMAMGDGADAAALQQARSLVQKARAAAGGRGRSAKAS
jgi:DNA repair protein RecN (Recombination protein N)